MGRSFTAAPVRVVLAPPLLLLLFLLGLLRPAAANVSKRRRTSRTNPSENPLLFSSMGLIDQWFGPWRVLPGGGLLLHERGLRRRPVVLRLRAQVLRLPLRPLRRHQPLPAHCKPSRRPPLRFSCLISSLLLPQNGRGAVMVYDSR